jgi:hypothetical protein
MSWQSACIVAACTSSIELTCPRTCGEGEEALESVLALRVGIARATYHLARNMRYRRVLVLRPVKLHRRILRTAKQHAENHAVAAS